MAGRKAAIEVYNQTPLFLFLRRICCRELGWIVVQELRNAEFIESERQRELSQPTPSSSLSHTPICQKNFFEFLTMVAKKGKREEGRRSKQGRNREAQDDNEEGKGTSRVLHIKNLKDNEQLKQVSMEQLLNGNSESLQQAVEILQTLDVSFLLYLLGNEIIKFRLSEQVQEALGKIKELRNEMIHSSQCSVVSVNVALENLCISMKNLLASCGKPFDFLEEEKEKCLKHAEASVNDLHHSILNSVKKELSMVSLDKDPNYQYSVYPGVKHCGRDGENESVLEDLKEFVQHQCKLKAYGETPPPLVLYGSSGVGKTTLLTQLAADFARDPHGPLVVHLRHDCCTMKQSEFWERVGEDVGRSAHETLREFGAKNLVRVLKIHTDRTLFIADWNICCLRDIKCGVSFGTWLITHCGTPEDPCPPNSLAVQPLTHPQVQQMLQSLSDSPERLISIYQNCTYKKILVSPDIVSVFFSVMESLDSVDRFKHFYGLLGSYVRTKTPSTNSNPEELLKLGKLAFNMIQDNCGKYYCERKLSKVRPDVWRLFLVPVGDREKDQFTFKYRVVEDFLAAQYVLQNPDITCRKWLKQYPLFKRVFRFVSSVWCENPVSVQRNLHHMRKYLSHFMDIAPERDPGAMEVGEPHEDRLNNKNNFTKWSYLLTLADDCNYQGDVIMLMAELLASKTEWHFRCRMLKDEVVENLPRVLSQVVLTRPLTVKLDSGCNTDTVAKLWRNLSTLNNIHAQASVHITINQSESHKSPCTRKLRNLASSLTSSGSRKSYLHVVKYIGPLSCSHITRFLRHPSLQKLQELDICVYDRPTLAEVLDCEGLEFLHYVDVKVVLRGSYENTRDEESELKIPDSVPFYLTIKYFPGLQNLLKKVKYPERLCYISIRSIYIHHNFKLDLSAFTGLSCLFLQFIPGSMEPIPNSLSSPLPSEPMDVDERWVDDLVETSAHLERRQWALMLIQNLVLPQGLQRLMLRDAEFFDDTNHFIVSQYLKKNHVKRLLVLDTDFSVTGAINLLKDFTSNASIHDVDMSPEFKRQCSLWHPSMSPLGTVPKQPRKSSEEREKLKKAERDRELKNELVVSSKHTKCFMCQDSPCSCYNLCDEDYWNRLEEMVVLARMTYQVSEPKFSFTNDSWFTVHVNACKDLRIQCRLTRLDDNTLAEPLKYEWLVRFFNETLVSAQFITLIDTQLTHQGAITLAKKVWSEKDIQGTPEPFSLTVCSVRHPSKNEADKHGKLVAFLKQDSEKGVTGNHTLAQFQFKCFCRDCCNKNDTRSQYHLRKTYSGSIVLNSDTVYQPPRR